MLDALRAALSAPPRPADIWVPPDRTPYYGNPPGDIEGTQSFGVPVGQLLDTRLSFVAGSVMIDNNTSQYINVPDATKDGTGRWIGPGQGGAFPILGHISRARINWSAPPGKNQPAGLPNEQAQVVFTAYVVPPGFGFAAPSQQTQPWLVARKATSVRAGLTAGGSVAIVAGVAGQVVTINHWSLILDAAANTSLTLQDDTDGTVIDYGFMNAQPWLDRPKYGFQLGAGHGIVLVNGANICTINGCLMYSQQ